MAFQHKTLSLRLVIAVCLTLLGPALAQQCWFPDGLTTSPQDKPCNASASASSCCNENDFCLDNGLCLHGGIISRGSCSDKNWGDGCPQWCTTKNPSGGVTLNPCSAFGNVFSCDWDSCTNDNQFSVSGGSGVMLRDSQVSPLGSPAAVVLQATSVLRSESSNGSQEASSNSTSSAVTASSSSQSRSDARYTAGDMAGVGVGVGVPLALALAGCIFLLARRRQPHKDQTQEYQSSQQPQSNAPQHMQPMMQNYAYHGHSPLSAPYSASLHKVDGQGRGYEMDHAQVGEMDANHERQELSAHSPR